MNFESPVRVVESPEGQLNHPSGWRRSKMKRFSLITILMVLILISASSALSTMNVDEKSGSCSIASEKTLLAASANCSEWSVQLNGCYERVCCCDQNGQHWCERCCPDKSGKCIAQRVKC